MKGFSVKLAMLLIASNSDENGVEGLKLKST